MSLLSRLYESMHKENYQYMTNR